MKADSISISKVFSGGGDVQYILPHFQREYAWDKENWETLLEDLWDVYEIYTPDDEPEHFMGALVVINDGTRNGTIPVFKLVDGQQRLTTISVLLSALGQLVKESHPALHKRIRKILLNLDEKDLLYYKLVPTAKRDDRDAYFHILDNETVPPQSESRIGGAFEYFLRNLRVKLAKNDPEKLSQVILNCLHVVFITLEQRERPYEIFESLNAKGKPLTAPDLVRNYIAMSLPENIQEAIFNKSWLAIEELLNENRTRLGIGELSAFLRHYLSLRGNSLCARDRIYQRFRDRMEKEFKAPEAFIGEVQTLHRYAIYYDRLLRPENEPHKPISIRLHRLNILETTTAYPFLMQVYADWDMKLINTEQFCEVLDILENYTIRRYLANFPSNYTNKLFPTLYREIDTGYYTDTLRRSLITKNYPSDNLIRETLRQRRLYEAKTQPRLAFLLDSINRHLSQNTGGYTVLDGNPTIEHIFPQTPSEAWQQATSDSEIDEILRDYVHTLGNLTLVTQEWNSTLSNSPYATKKRRLANHALLINQAYFGRDDAPIQWDKNSIITRTEALASVLLDIWGSLGEARMDDSSDYSGKKPRALSILGDIFEVTTWRAILITMAELGIEFGVFEEMRERFPRTFTTTDRERSVLLPNGWWLYTSKSANAVMDFCEKTTDLMGLSDEEWEVLYE